MAHWLARRLAFSSGLRIEIRDEACRLSLKDKQAGCYGGGGQTFMCLILAP